MLRKIVMSALGFALASAASVPAGNAQMTERTVRLFVSAEPVVGTLTLPEGTADVPGVLIVPGSGPVDRDGNFPGGHNDHLKLLAQGLAARGIAALRIDKRGVGASRPVAPHEDQLDIGLYISDTDRWLDRLRAEPRVGHVFLLGHSEGALIATIAAQRVHPNGLILLGGIGTKAGATIRRQLDASGMAAPLRASAERILTSLERRETVTDIEPELAALFRPSVQPYLLSWLPIDPAFELAAVSAPILVVQGTTDIQVTLEDARLLVAARLGIESKTIDGMNHILKTAPEDRAANIASYNDASLPLAPELIPILVEFIARH
jgi:alpha-beta hydrolase superfamily lysophospholipase